jgi:IS30 family transposase
MAYRQLSRDERVALATLRREGLSAAAIAKKLGRHRSTIGRELKRNWDRSSYRPVRAEEKAGWRRRGTRRHGHFSDEQLEIVNGYLREKLSPEQISGTLRRNGQFSISHETIYQHVWRDQNRGGSLYTHLRQRLKKRRKRYGSNDSRGKLPGKRLIDQRPKIVDSRTTIGHWEIDTVIGRGSKACLLTMVERKTGYLLMGKLSARTTAEVNRMVVELIKRHPGRVKTITADNGTEFHGHEAVEAETGVPFYFAHPHHSWERGTNENTNGLVRQYLPKGISFCRLTQDACDNIALALNNRPRKRHGFISPSDCFLDGRRVALQP